jgi:23S rRNA (guanosine2251-2'-O)-methyltransferase
MSAELIMGVNAVITALSAGRRRILELYINPNTKSPALQSAIELTRKMNVPIVPRSREELTELLGSESHQGIAIKAHSLPNANLKDLLTMNAEKSPAPLLILEGIEDPHNLGAILRSALALGSRGVILRERRAVGLTPTTFKVAAGAPEYLPMCQVANINQAMKQAKDFGFWIVGLSGKAEESIVDFRCEYPLVLVLGSEGEGLSRLVERNCDSLVRIPINRLMDSLNVSVAAAIALWELGYGRKKVI